MTNYLAYMGMVGRFIDGMYDTYTMGDTRNFKSSISKYLYRFLLVVETILYKHSSGRKNPIQTF